MLTIGQYLQPSRHHLPVERYVTPEEFDQLGAIARGLGFAMSPAARWCARPTTPTCRRRA
jgi:lipoate synthase